MESADRGVTPDSVRYAIDADDRIVSVDAGWVAFARANRSEALLPGRVVGRSLWEFIADDTTRLVYQEMIARARTRQTVQFTFRCDTPWMQRVLDMRIEGRDDGVVEFATQVISKTPVEYQPLIDPAVRRRGEWVRMCSWCKRVHVGGNEWCEVAEALNRLGLFLDEGVPPVTHGMCNSCRDQMRAIAK